MGDEARFGELTDSDFWKLHQLLRHPLVTPEAVDETQARLARVEHELELLRQAVLPLAEETKAARKHFEQVGSDVNEMVEVFRSFRESIKVLHWIGKLAKPMAYVAALFSAIAGFWIMLKGGGPPHTPPGGWNGGP